MYNKLFSIFASIVFALAFMAPVADAQLSNVVPAPIQYTVSPSNPGPNTQVTITAQGVGTFLGDANISWSLNGKVVSQAVGARTFTFATGGLGSVTRVHVSIHSPSQGSFSNDWSFSPSLITLVWEADTSVPPFYRGKALYSGGANLSVVALPTVVIAGKSIAPQNLSYQWTVNDIPAPDISGLGRAKIQFAGDQLQNAEDVSVDVSYGANDVGQAEVVIPATTPQVLLYDRDPLRGLMLDEALPSAFALNTKEFTIQAMPYYFSTNSLANGDAAYAWTLNGEDTTGPNAAKGELTLRQTGSGTGSATVGVSVQNNNSDLLVQAAQAVAQIVFGNTSSSGTSLFGL